MTNYKGKDFLLKIGTVSGAGQLHVNRTWAG
jgi:hypothetical protein